MGKKELCDKDCLFCYAEVPISYSAQFVSFIASKALKKYILAHVGVLLIYNCMFQYAQKKLTKIRKSTGYV